MSVPISTISHLNSPSEGISRQLDYLTSVWPLESLPKYYSPPNIQYTEVHHETQLSNLDKIVYVNEEDKSILWKFEPADCTTDEQHMLYQYSRNESRASYLLSIFPRVMMNLINEYDGIETNTFLIQSGITDLVWNSDDKQVWYVNRVTKELGYYCVDESGQMQSVKEDVLREYCNITYTSSGYCLLTHSRIVHPSKKRNLSLWRNELKKGLVYKIFYDEKFDRYLILNGNGGALMVFDNTDRLVYSFKLGPFIFFKSISCSNGHLLVFDSKELWILSIVPTRLVSTYYWPTSLGSSIRTFYVQGSRIFLLLKDSSLYTIDIDWDSVPS